MTRSAGTARTNKPRFRPRFTAYYLFGSTAALGNWNTGLGLPVDLANYPVWSNTVNLPAASNVQYKYYRKNGDGSVTWENLPGGGNRTLNVPASGGAALNDTVGW